jgi:conjugative relaxase-like TrwC/TraI family protein
MLSIGKIALGQHRYYEQQVARGGDDYYSGRGEAPGAWVGAGAAALGLSGQVTADQFSALIAGLDPHNAEVRLRSSEHDPKIAAFDLTFSAPKSISVLFAIAPEPISGRLIECHEEAVAAALGYLEDTAVMVRRGHGGQHVERAEGLIAAAYRHRMSRALDPQLHTHVVAGNLARGSDGRFTALHSSLLYTSAKTAGTLYQAHLRALVTERLGLEWGEVQKGAAELLCVVEAVLEHFSKRRAEMEREAQAGGIGLGSKSAAESAALATRDRKHYGLDTHTWREEVRARAAELGLGAEEVELLLREGIERIAAGLAERGAIDERVLGDVLAGAAGLTERANTFDSHPVLQEFASAATAGALVGEVRAQAARFVKRADVLPLGQDAMTTAELTACERRLIAAAIGRAGEGAGKLASPPLAMIRRPLNDEQTIAVRAVVSSGDGVSVIQALAGTGKTYTAGALREIYEAAGYEVMGAAPTGRAVRELAEQAGVPSRTIDRLLGDLDRTGEQLPAGHVLILDEAGMAPTRLSARLLQAAEQAGVKVIAIGDPGQLASVQAGGWLAAIGRQLGIVTLREVMRQRDPAERRALAQLHDGTPRKYLQWADRAQRIETFHEPGHAIERTLAEWRNRVGESDPARTVMIARENETRDLLNQRAREHQNQAGLLGEQRTYGNIAIAAGDRVICRRNDQAVDVDNGTRGTVLEVDPEYIRIATDNGGLREMPASYVAEHVEHAYTLTGHGMQGGTVENAIVLASPHDLTAGWSYTALSRARGHTQLLIYEEQYAQRRQDIAPTENVQPVSRAELLARVAKRMLERDDEDLAIEQLPAAEQQDPGSVTEVDARPRLNGDVDTRTRPSSEAPESVEQTQQRAAQLRAHLDALPSRQLQRIADLQARTLTLSTQQEQTAQKLAELPVPRRRMGREHDPHAIERSHLLSALQAIEAERQAVNVQLAHVEAEIRDPTSARLERERLQRELASLMQEHPDLEQQRQDDLDRHAGIEIEL